MCGVTPEMCFYPPVFTCILNFYMGGKKADMSTHQYCENLVTQQV